MSVRILSFKKVPFPPPPPKNGIFNRNKHASWLNCCCCKIFVILTHIKLWGIPVIRSDGCLSCKIELGRHTGIPIITVTRDHSWGRISRHELWRTALDSMKVSVPISSQGESQSVFDKGLKQAVCFGLGQLFSCLKDNELF